MRGALRLVKSPKKSREDPRRANPLNCNLWAIRHAECNSWIAMEQGCLPSGIGRQVPTFSTSWWYTEGGRGIRTAAHFSRKFWAMYDVLS